MTDNLYKQAEEWMERRYGRRQVELAYFKVTDTLQLGSNTVLFEAINRMTHDDQVELVLQAEKAFDYIEDPSERLRRIHELKWKL